MRGSFLFIGEVDIVTQSWCLENIEMLVNVSLYFKR